MSRSTLEEHLNSQDFNCAPTPFSPDGINLLDPPLPIQKPFFQEGLLRLQDEAAQLVSHLASPQSGKNILDVCSGSGGKTSHLAALMKNQGRIVALDRDTEKLAQLNKDASRQGISIIETMQADLTCPLPALLTGQFDVVLVDAPCSGTGTLRRNPEIKWRLKSSDISAHAKLQKTILQNAATAVQKTAALFTVPAPFYPRKRPCYSWVLSRLPAVHGRARQSPRLTNLCGSLWILQNLPSPVSDGRLFRRRFQTPELN